MADSKNKTILNFEDLITWQKAQEAAVHIYKLTDKFPDSERYGMTDQLKRAVSSISANIAEGFGRPTSKDKVHFYYISYGSLLEVKNFIYLAHKLNYIDEELQTMTINQLTDCQKLIHGLIRSTKK